MLDDYPVFIRAYDILFDGDLDVRPETFLANEHERSVLSSISWRPRRFDLSPLVSFSTWEELEKLRAAAPPDPVIEGVC